MRCGQCKEGHATVAQVRQCFTTGRKPVTQEEMAMAFDRLARDLPAGVHHTAGGRWKIQRNPGMHGVLVFRWDAMHKIWRDVRGLADRYRALTAIDKQLRSLH